MLPILPYRTQYIELRGNIQSKFLRHCDADCTFEGCSELAFELWERVVFGGAQVVLGCVLADGYLKELWTPVIVEGLNAPRG